MVSFFDQATGWDLPPQGVISASRGSFSSGLWDGSKFSGGLGAAEVLLSDPWSLRQHSSSFFKTNLYARGLLRRLITNEINQGLSPECNPDESILGIEPGGLEDWSDLTEARFALWANAPQLCDLAGLKTFGEIQEQARLEALIEGDVLVVLHIDPVRNLPLVEIIPGSQVVSPLQFTPAAGNRITEGVELDAQGRHMAFFVQRPGQKLVRIAARGEKTGRRIAWLHYGTEKRSTDVRGDPLLSIVLQSLRELDRYRDAAQRKAAINSLIAMFVKKTQDKIGSLELGKATRYGATPETVALPSGASFKTAAWLPGIVIDDLQHGEEPTFIGGEGTDVNLGAFEGVILNAIAWANEVPPEILMLSFEKNYSASQAAINEFKNYICKRWKRTGETLCTPIFTDWLIAEALTGKHETPGLLEALFDPLRYDTLAALTTLEWYGTVKPATDLLKAARGSQVLISEGWSTNTRGARQTTGTDFRKNCSRLRRENDLKTQAWEPMAAFLQKYPGWSTIQAQAAELAAQASAEVIDDA